METEEAHVDRNWRRLPEAGTVLGIRFVVALATLAGRTAASAFLAVLAGYYVLFSARARHASQEFLVKVGELPSLRNVHRQIHMFARATLDRLFFLQDRLAPFAITTHGHEHLAKLHETGRGAILIGSHLGSFEAMRAASRDEELRLAIVVDDRSAARLGRVLRELSPHHDVTVIPVDPTGFGTALRVKAAIERGEIVGILADRASPDDTRNAFVDFLGETAPLPTGPFLIAHTLKCPVYLVFGLFQAPNRYDLYCEPFAAPLVLDRADRQGSLAVWMQRYAARLEHFTRQSPYNWFNLYAFWRRPALRGTGSDGSRS